MGYLDLSFNADLSLERLRPLARAHVLELYLGGDSSPAPDRLCILKAVPNVWVLNGEYVTAYERRLADHLDWLNNDDGSDCNSNHAKLQRWHVEGAKCTALGPESLDETGGSRDTRDSFEGEGRTQGHHRQKRTRRQEMFNALHPEYRDLDRQGHLAREFFEDVVWKLPSRYSIGKAGYEGCTPVGHFRIIWPSSAATSVAHCYPSLIFLAYCTVRIALDNISAVRHSSD